VPRDREQIRARTESAATRILRELEARRLCEAGSARRNGPSIISGPDPTGFARDRRSQAGGGRAGGREGGWAPGSPRSAFDRNSAPVRRLLLAEGRRRRRSMRGGRGGCEGGPIHENKRKIPRIAESPGGRGRGSVPGTETRERNFSCTCHERGCIACRAIYRCDISHGRAMYRYIQTLARDPRRSSAKREEYRETPS